MAETAAGELVCGRCGGEVRESARFCPRCGTSLSKTRTCPKCGGETPSDGRFCDQCGHEEQGRARTPVAAEPAPRARSEKRVVTVLFADVVGFTKMAEHLEPEDITEMMNRLFDRLTELVLQNGGSVDKYIGDCMMAVFGAPKAFGDDAERAVRASLQIQKALPGIAETLKIPLETLKLRVGLNTGFVMAGFVGGEGHRDYTVMGDTVNLASRMETACSPGRVLITSNTQRFVASRFVTEDAGEFEVKGRDESVRGFYVRRERRAGIDDRGFFFEGVPIPFIGREREVELLEANWRAVGDERCTRVVAIEAPSGIGKSRLLTEFCWDEKRGLSIRDFIHGRGAGHAGDVVMVPLHAGLRRLLETRHGGVDEAIRTLLADEGDDSGAMDAARTVLRDYFSGAEIFAAVGGEGRSVRQTLFWALAVLLGALSAESPVMLVVSDAHMADEALCEFVAYLAGEEAPPAAVLVLWEFQSGAEETSAQVLDLTGDRLTRCELGPLTDAELARMVSALLARCPTVPRWVESWVVQRSEGNPLYCIEQIRLLRTMQIVNIDLETGHWSVKEHAPTDTELPTTIHAALQASLDNHPTVEREVLQAAAVVGRVFWDGAVEAVLDGRHPVVAVERGLQTLRVQGVLKQRAVSSFAGLTEYRFQSDLFQQVCYQALPGRDRREAHALVAARLEREGASSTQPLGLVRHYERAGQAQTAIPLLLDVAEHAVAAYSLKEARDAVARTTRLLEAHPRNGDQSGRIAGIRDRVRLGLCGAELSRIHGRLDEALEQASESMALLALPERRDEPENRREAHHRARLHALRGRVLKDRDDFEGAIEAFRAAIAVAPIDGEHVAFAVDWEADLSWCLSKSGQEQEAERILKQVFQRYSEGGIEQGSLANAVARHHDTQAEMLRNRGEIEAAGSHYRQARTLREIEGNVRLLAHSDGNLAVTRGMSGEWGAAATGFGRVLGLWSALGDRRMTCISHLNLAECFTHLGRAAEALEHVDSAEAIAKALGAEGLLTAAAEIRANAAA